MHTTLPPLRLAALFLALWVWPAAAAAADDALPTPTGPVVLTIAGNIGAVNRPPFGAQQDAFLNYHEKRFAKAAAFDRAMLEALGMHEIELGFKDWPKKYRFRGPRLKDVLAAVRSRGQSITVFAMDGYAEEISAADLNAHEWIVAVKRDGRYLNIGQHGPLWVVYAVPGDHMAAEVDHQRWPWAVFYIEVK